MTTYEEAHRRVRSIRGPASSHRCLNCGDSAQHWSYRNDSANEVVGTMRSRPGTVRYSTDPEDYDPLCVLCHRIRDRQIARDVWDWRGYSIPEVEAALVEDFRAELEDLPEYCTEEGLDYDEEVAALTREYIAKAKQVINFVARYRLMFGAP